MLNSREIADFLMNALQTRSCDFPLTILLFVCSVVVFGVGWILILYFSVSYTSAELNYAISLQGDGVCFIHSFAAVAGLFLLIGAVGLLGKRKIWAVILMIMALIFGVDLYFLKQNSRLGHAITLHRMSNWLASETFSSYSEEMRAAQQAEQQR